LIHKTVQKTTIDRQKTADAATTGVSGGGRRGLGVVFNRHQSALAFSIQLCLPDGRRRANSFKLSLRAKMNSSKRVDVPKPSASGLNPRHRKAHRRAVGRI